MDNIVYAQVRNQVEIQKEATRIGQDITFSKTRRKALYSKYGGEDDPEWGDVEPGKGDQSWMRSGLKALHKFCAH